MLPRADEMKVTDIQMAQAVAALDAGLNVIVDDLNLRSAYVRRWYDLAKQHGAVFLTQHVDTPLEECVARDSARERTVGEKVIRDLAAKFLRKGRIPEFQEPQEPVAVMSTGVAEPSIPAKVKYNLMLPSAILVDIDGTMALNNGHRGWFEWKKVGADSPNSPVVALVNLLITTGHRVIFCSGRDEICRKETSNWLRRYIPAKYDSRWDLLMRSEGDNRVDSIVKREIFDAEVRDKYNVEFVLDDRDSVVAMWRSLGLSVFQVAPGAF